MYAEWQLRVIEEKQDLDKKLEALCLFTYGRTFQGIPLMEQERLNAQRHFMCAYSAILGERIAHFQEVPNAD